MAPQYCTAVSVELWPWGHYPRVTPFSFHKPAAQSGRYATTPNSDLRVHQGEALVLVLLVGELDDLEQTRL